MAKIFDSHAHYDDEKFEAHRRDALLHSLFEGDVGAVLNAGTNLQTCRASLSLAHEYSGIYAAVGIHPSDCFRYESIDATLGEVCDMLNDEKAVAIGEIGLDYHYDFSPRDIQRKWFDAQLSLAEQTGCVAVVHDRDAHGDVFDMIRAHPRARVIMHSCSASAELVRALTSLGHYISFSGSVTFKNARSVAQAAACVPSELLLMETDCPYLTPHPHRGELNHSGYLVFTAQKLAQLRGEEYEEVLERTYENALRAFGITEKD